MRCMVPDTGITINPIGELVLCCAGDNVAIGHIKDIDNVSDFFNSDVYKDLRKKFKLKELEAEKVKLDIIDDCNQKSW